MTQHNRLQKLARGEEGFSLVFVATGLLAFIAVSMLAIDLGMLMTSRAQAQNSADASALAGATALVFDSWDDRSPSGPAVQNALTAAVGNQVMGGVVSIAPVDVVFSTIRSAETIALCRRCIATRRTAIPCRPS